MVDDEAWRVLADHRGVARKVRERNQAIDRLLRGTRAADHLDHLHQRHGVEEVVAGDAFGPVAGRGDRGDGQRRGVADEHGIGGDDRFEQHEQITLDVEPFDDRFDDQIAVGEALQGVDRRDAGYRRGCAVGGHASLFGELAERVAQAVEGGLNGGWLGVEEDGFATGLGIQLDDAASHCTGADDAHALER
jgi:hypothetical protein